MTNSGLVVTILFIVYENVAPIVSGTTSFEYFCATQLKMHSNVSAIQWFCQIAFSVVCPPKVIHYVYHVQKIKANLKSDWENNVPLNPLGTTVFQSD